MDEAQAPQHHLSHHVAMLTTPGLGHVIPFLELAKKLTEKHGFKITMIMLNGNVPQSSSSTKKDDGLLTHSNPNLSFVYLPPVNLDDLPADAKLETRIMLGVNRSIPALRRTLKELNGPGRDVLSALVVDLFCTITFDMVQELGIPKYVYSPSSAMVLSATLYLPELDKTCTCEYRDLPEPIKFPGCTVPVRGSDLMGSVDDRKNEAYRLAIEHCKNYLSADGLIINNFSDLEIETFEALNQLAQSATIPPVYPVGPLTRTGSTRESHDLRCKECLQWLDNQPLDSVLFVSFGSGGTLSRKQLNHLALGLEMSGQRFLFVVKCPNDESRNAAYFTDAKEMNDPYEFLPGGFKERTREKGFVLARWAPQIEVLAHGSVGGFLSHCGWNSTLESIVHGVPLVAWPLYAEQKMNAVLLSDALKVAIRVTVEDDGEDGIVGCEQISKVVRDLIEGDEGGKMRERMRGLRDAADRALKEDGSSTKALARVAEIWMNDGKGK